MPQTPTDPLKAQVWVTGEAPNQQLEFYIPAGPKGDPGGLTSTAIPATTHLDDIVVAGAYHLTAGADAAASATQGLPMHEAGTLLVTYSQLTATIQIQTYITNTKGIYIRRRFSGTWGAWRHFGPTRTDQTAGRTMHYWDEINQREQLAYGDTGRRNITPPDFTGGAVTVRRHGAQVALYVVGGTLANSGNYTFPESLPVGFRPPANCYYLYRQNVTMTTNPIMVTSAGQIQVINYSNATNFSAIATWDTADAWPATLPGSASGSVPNT